MVGARGELQLEQTAKISRTILVIEDEILVRMVLADKLREAGYTVVEAASAEEALGVLAHRFDVKVVLSDVQMPGSMDGVALARVVRSAYPKVKIVITSGHVDAIKGAEHDGFFTKPYDTVQIIGHIETLFD
jgi:CheY-like chemotaxis protein